LPSMTFFPVELPPEVERRDEGHDVVFQTRCRGDRLSRRIPATVQVRTTSLFQFWGRSFPLSGSDYLPHVLPSRAKVPEQTFERAMRNNQSLFVGARVRTRMGAPDQFHSHRPYRHGDPFRFVDHKKSARYGELVTKTFDSIVDQTVIIGMDLGRSMSGTIAGSEKLSFYKEAAYHLIENALQSRDRVGFFGFAGKTSLVIPPTRNLNAFA